MGNRNYSYMNGLNKNNFKHMRFLIVSGVLVLVLLVALYFQAFFFNFLVLRFLSSPIPFILVVIALGLAGYILWMGYNRPDYNYTSSINKNAVKKSYARKMILFGVIVALTFIGSFAIAITNNFFAQKQIMNTVTVTKEPMPTYAQRAAFPVARAQAVQAVTDPGSDLGITRYIPTQDRYTGLVAKRGWFTGFSEIISQEVALTGSAKSTRCVFSPAADKRVGAWFTNNLKRSFILKAGINNYFNNEDIYGYCDKNNAPVVVWPYSKYKNIFPAYLVPAGVAVYNGQTGEISLHEGVVKAGDIEGPVYPQSLSKEAREATHASGSIADYLFNRAGYEDTSSDEGDPNGDNRAEFNLNRHSNEGNDWVTPLTLRGASTSVAGISQVSSTSITPGQLNPMTINLFEPHRAANSAVLARVKSDYSHDNLNWADTNLRIWEIAPVSNKEWVASVGYDRNIIARVRLQSDLTSCLEDGKGNKIRCSNENSDGPAPTPGNSGSSTVANGKDLSKMSPDELSTLQDAVTKELVKRAKASSQTPAK